MGWVAAAVQVTRDLFALPRPITLELQPLRTFDTAPRPVDRVIAEMRNLSGGTVSRDEAMSVASVQRGRNDLCSIATLPLRLFRGLDVVDSPLFRQFDPDVPNVVHMAGTIEDLALESIAWWQVTGQDFELYPVSVRRIPPARVTLRPPRGREAPGPGRWVWVDGDDGRGPQHVPAALMIRFDSPNPGILRANARAIRRALLLDQVAAMYAENPSLREWFTDGDATDVDPMGEDEIDSFLSEYGAARRQRPYGWIPGNVKRADVSAPSPRDLTLPDLQRQVTLEIANGLGVDPEDLGVSTTSRTYQNAVDRKQDKINRVYSMYMRAITDRLAMGDVTRRGYAPQFDLTEYLKSDPVTQASYWKALKDMGVVDAAWIGEQAGITQSVVGRAAVAPAVQPAIGQNAHRPAIQLGDVTPRFAGENPAFIFTTTDFASPPPPPTVDQATRTITGLAVPYSAVASKYGLKMRFQPGSLEYSAPERMAHLKDHVTPVGFHRSVTDTPQGPVVALGVLDGPAGSPAKSERDQLLYDAANGLYTGLSVGVDFSMDPERGDVEYNAAEDVYDVVRATWRETSTTYMPAFDDARVTQVSASLTGGFVVPPCPHCAHRHAPNIACATFRAQLLQPTPAPVPDPAPQPGPQPQPTPQFGGDIAGQFAAFQSLMLAQQAAAPAPTAGPTLVNPDHQAATVTEPDPYFFSRDGNLHAGTHDFSSDLLTGWRDGDKAARDRAEAFVEKTFAVTPGNVTALNYPTNKTDMYVDQLEYQYPIWNAVNKGTLDAITPFVVPKFSTATGLVAEHVTGTEPTPGAFTATAQTITPSAVSGKVEITREAFDQGGNPQMSGLIWRQMVRGYYEALEAFVVAQLAAAAASIPDIVVTALATDSALDQALADAFVPLQYIRGGDRFRTVFTQIDLYKAMVKAKDTAGRRLYPSIGAQNAVGTVAPNYSTLDAHGKLFVPAWATAATGTVAASSWMFDPEKVCAWASAPKKIELEWRVAWVDVGLFGYKAFAITDFNGTRELLYDPI